MRAFAGRSCGPPHLRAMPFHPAAERRDLHEPSAKGRLRAAAHMCEFADGTKAIRRCRPPPDAADGTRRSNGVPRQDGITRSIDCSVFFFGQRRESPSREPRYGFRLFAMIFKTSLAELYRAYSPYNKFRNLFSFISSFARKKRVCELTFWCPPPPATCRLQVVNRPQCAAGSSGLSLERLRAVFAKKTIVRSLQPKVANRYAGVILTAVVICETHAPCGRKARTLTNKRLRTQEPRPCRKPHLSAVAPGHRILRRVPAVNHGLRLGE